MEVPLLSGHARAIQRHILVLVNVKDRKDEKSLNAFVLSRISGLLGTYIVTPVLLAVSLVGRV